MEKSGRWPMLHLERQGISQVRSESKVSEATVITSAKEVMFSPVFFSVCLSINGITQKLHVLTRSL